MTRFSRCSLAAVALHLSLFIFRADPPAPLAAQDGRSLDATINGVGISIGDSPEVIGLRLNFRDRYLRRVDGVNITIWSPHEETGVVNGIAVGLPMTGAREINGITLAPAGVVVGDRLRGLTLTLGGAGAGGRIEGITVAAAGIGSGEDVRGLSLAGVGIGTRDDLRGAAIAGIGLGVGRDLRGIGAGGIGLGVGRDLRGAGAGIIGVGVGGDMHGLVAGGIGTGIGGDARGLAAGGVGVGIGNDGVGIVVGGVGAAVGGDMLGLSIAGVGLGIGGDLMGVSLTGIGFGAGGDVKGVHVAGLGIGAGGTLQGLSLSGGGIGAPRIEGVAVALAIGTNELRGLAIAPAYFRVDEGGNTRGVNVSAFNHIRGTQRGLAIGIVNFARVLDGTQIGLLNYAANKSSWRLLPIVNHARS